MPAGAPVASIVTAPQKQAPLYVVCGVLIWQNSSRVVFYKLEEWHTARKPVPKQNRISGFPGVRDQPG
jgi:hypothetical protein